MTLPKKTGSFSWSRSLLDFEPYDLRETIETSGGVKESGLEFFLTNLESDARACLKANVPDGMTPELKLSDLHWAWREPRTFDLDQRQEAAVAVLMHAYGIRLLFIEFDAYLLWEKGALPLGVFKPGRDAKELAEQVAFEVLQFTLAAIRGDFIELADLETMMRVNEIERKNAMRKLIQSAKGGKQRIFDRKQKHCQDILLTFSKSRTNPYSVVCNNWKFNWGKLSEQDRRDIGQTPPSKRHVQRYLKNLNGPIQSNSTLSVSSQKKLQATSKLDSKATHK